MSRIFCPCCKRPESACICQFTTPISNDIHVVVLQHPSEVKQVKGTISLLSQSLNSCQVVVGEDFSDDKTLVKVFEDYQPLLLYPSEKSKVLDKALMDDIKQKYAITIDEGYKQNIKPLCLIILDGTWKKAYRIYMLFTKLHDIPQVHLPDYLANAGQYHIRKVARQNALSSLEATCFALALLEHKGDPIQIKPNKAGKYQTLLTKFNAFNQFQLSFRPEAHRS